MYHWLEMCFRNQSLGRESTARSGKGSCYMLKIDSFHHLAFRRIQKESKVYAHITAYLMHLQTGIAVPKLTKTIRLLKESSPYLFELKDSLPYYFYSEIEDQLEVRIEVSLSE